MRSQFEAFIEDDSGKVIGYIDAKQKQLMLPVHEQFPRALQNTHADTAAVTLGVELPAAVKKALKDLPDEVAAPRTAEPGLE